MSRFFLPAAQLTTSRVLLSGSEFHHLHHVLRLTTGDSVTLCDEQGKEYQGTIIHLSSVGAEVAIASVSVPVSAFSLTLAQAVLKGPKMDWVIEKSTELGVQRIVPFFSTFTVAQVPAERSSERLARWRRIAQSAAKQSGSPLPIMSEPCTFHALLALPAAHVAKILLHEKERTFTLKAFARTHPPLSSLWVVIGPEGGLSTAEVAQAQAAGFHIVGLGLRVLRAETAAIAAVALSQFLWGNGAPPLSLE